MLDAPSEQIFKNESFLNTIAEFSGFETDPDRIGLKAAVHTKKTFNPEIEIKPVGEEWHKYKLYSHVIQLAEKMGYDMSKETVSRLISKFQLSLGIMPWVRHKTGYWNHRKRVGDLLRKAGLR